MYGQGEIRGNLELIELVSILPFKHILFVATTTIVYVRMYEIEGSSFMDL